MGAMNKEEILQGCRWDDLGWARIEVYSEMFGRNIEVRLMPDIDSGPRLTDRMVAVLNDFLVLTREDLETVKQYLWEDCLRDFEDIDYGVAVAAGETLSQANQREFGIRNAEEAYARSSLKRLSIPEEPTLRNRYGAIDFEPEWAGHGCSIIMKNGQLIASYSNDWYFSKYEDEEPKE
ncbi:DUF6985 domain-containing protein [Archangium violaceum]|uniref:DUF6985 domain-containing protein n=1 Tax=Archangium violaceum TaxID=83451 RepID=UPI0036DBCC40